MKFQKKDAKLIRNKRFGQTTKKKEENYESKILLLTNYNEKLI
jgi:hypothetical protein